MLKRRTILCSELLFLHIVANRKVRKLTLSYVNTAQGSVALAFVTCQKNFIIVLNNDKVQCDHSANNLSV